MEVLIRIAQLVLSLSILVIIHEFGHFIFARLFKVRVDKFYLFFNPGFSLFKRKIGETTYGIGWLPLGGYVKIAGMIDESMDKEVMAQKPKPNEFRSLPAWQRLLIMIGGVLFNFLLAIFIYIMVLFAWGENYLSTQKMQYGIVPDSTAISIGFEAGDKILSIDHKKVERFNEIATKIILDEAKTVQVERNGQQLDIQLPDHLISDIIKNNNILFFPRYPFIIADFIENSPAKSAGLQKGDIIQKIDTIDTRYSDLLPQALAGYKNQTVPVTISRSGELHTFDVSVNENAQIGIYADFEAAITLDHKKYSFAESIPVGISKGYTTAKDYLKQIKLLFSPKVNASESVGGFISIGKIFPAEWNWQSFWQLTAFLSVMLAIVNLLPIPALDGGHVMFLFYEVITRRKPSDKFMEYAQIAGMTLLILLVVYANGNDIIKLFK